MNRVAITGAGIVSSLGNDLEAVKDSLLNGKSGIIFNESFKEKGLRSHISGNLNLDPTPLVDRKLLRFMGLATAWGHIAMKQAVEQSGLTQEQLSDETTELIIGSGGVESEDLVDAINCLETKGIKKVGPYRVTREMSSAPSAALATAFKIRGPSYSISSACATSAHCIGTAYQHIKMGLQKTVIAGGLDHSHWSQAMLFDGMGALSTQYNDTPTTASRPYDSTRDGFVISGGAGVLVLEDWDQAKARGATILAEVIGFGASSDGDDMVKPSGEGAERAMKHALRDAGLNSVDYINTHGTSTPAGDITELKAIARTFPEQCPLISSTKSLSGHGLGAAGVHEAIYSMLMMQNDFVAASANLNEPDSVAAELPLVRETKHQAVNTALSNSFGFGGTNACLILAKA